MTDTRPSRTAMHRAVMACGCTMRVGYDTALTWHLDLPTRVWCPHHGPKPIRGVYATHSLEDVAAELGIDLDALDEEDE